MPEPTAWVSAAEFLAGLDRFVTDSRQKSGQQMPECGRIIFVFQRFFDSQSMLIGHRVDIFDGMAAHEVHEALGPVRYRVADNVAEMIAWTFRCRCRMFSRVQCVAGRQLRRLGRGIEHVTLRQRNRRRRHLTGTPVCASTQLLPPSIDVILCPPGPVAVKALLPTSGNLTPLYVCSIDCFVPLYLASLDFFTTSRKSFSSPNCVEDTGNPPVMLCRVPRAFSDSLPMPLVAVAGSRLILNIANDAAAANPGT